MVCLQSFPHGATFSILARILFACNFVGLGFLVFLIKMMYCQLNDCGNHYRSRIFMGEIDLYMKLLNQVSYSSHGQAVSKWVFRNRKLDMVNNSAHFFKSKWATLISMFFILIKYVNQIYSGLCKGRVFFGGSSPIFELYRCFRKFCSQNFHFTLFCRESLHISNPQI